MAVGVKFTGARQVKRAIDLAVNRIIAAEGAALQKEGFDIIAQAKLMVPVETGRLRNTGYVSRPKTTFAGLRVEAGFGTDYAEPVHEDPLAFHPTGGPYYLEIPFRKALAGWKQRIAKNTRYFWKRRIGLQPMAGIPSAPKDKGADWQASRRRSMRRKRKR